MKSRRILGLAGILALILCLGLAAATRSARQERILDYDSLVKVHLNGSMTVAETIRVVAAGGSIRHGIYRDFPTTYKDSAGNTYRVEFRVLRVSRDGRPESFHLKALSNGVRIYMGKKGVILQPGVYTFTLVYRTNRQLGFFKDHDELYWNVTGNGWSFPIDHVTATVVLPPGARVLKSKAYTGFSGQGGHDYKIGTDENGRIVFETTRPLRPREGLTIVVAWPKGFVHEPTAAEKAGYFLKDNGSIIAAVAGLVLLFLYYLVAWLKVGKDPKSGTIIPRFHPPKGLSPAAVRFVKKMGFDPKTFAVAIVDLAVKGALKIVQDGDKAYTLRHVSSSVEGLSKGEKALLDRLFLTDGLLVLKQENHQRIRNSQKTLEKTLKQEYEKSYFVRNMKWFITGIVLTLLTLGGMILFSGRPSEAGFMGLWLVMWSGGVVFLLKMAVNAWRVRKGAIKATLFALPFLAGEVFGLVMFASAVSPLAAAVFLGIILLDFLFYHLLKAPTRHGRVILDEIEGFKMYLETAEEERLKLLHPPDKTPELFERYLPYAMALDVENAWSRKFEDVLARAAEQGYRPGWYSGGYLATRGFSGLAGGLGSSLSSAVASSSVAPGSSSGFGGGGGSGGGGGGGGGGGW